MSFNSFPTDCLYCKNDDAIEMHEGGIYIQVYCPMCGYQHTELNDSGFERLRDNAYEIAVENNIPEDEQDEYVEKIIGDVVKEYLENEVGPNKIPTQSNIKKANIIIKYINILKPAHDDFDISNMTTISQLEINTDLYEHSLNDLRKVFMEGLFSYG